MTVLVEPFGENRMDIVHVALDERPVKLAAKEPYTPVLVVFWRNEFPVGHVYARRDGNGTIAFDDLAVCHALPERKEKYAVAEDVPRTASVIICTRDRPEILGRCLSSFKAQTRAPDELIVVDNAPRDGATEKICRTHNVVYVREEIPGLDFARNAGVRRATSDIVAFADDDVILHRRWLERTVSAFDCDTVMAVTGLVLPAELETRAQIIFERHWGFGRGYRRIDFDCDFFQRYRPLACPSWEIGAGASMAFRRSVFGDIGYFDERLDVGAAGCSGDSEFWYRVLAGGWTCRYEPSAVAFHFHRRNEADLARQIRAYMRGHVAALLVQYERHRDWGNLRRVLFTLPRWYALRYVRRIRHGLNDRNAFLSCEVKGALSGILYYLRAPRPGRERAH